MSPSPQRQPRTLLPQILLPLTLCLFTSCRQLAVDNYPIGLGTHCQAYLRIPANLGASLGIALGIPLSLALAPITLPSGYLWKKEPGALALLLYPILWTGYALGTLAATIPYLLTLPFRPPPLQDPCPEVRYRAILLAGREKDLSKVQPLLKILKKDILENQLAAAQALGQIQAPNAILPLLQTTLSPQTNELLRLQCQQTLRQFQNPKSQKQLLQLTHSTQLPIARASLKLLQQLPPSHDYIQRLIQLLQSPLAKTAKEILQKIAGKQLPTPQAWKQWAQKHFPQKHTQITQNQTQKP